MKQKYIKDNDGNKILPITSVTAVRDSEGQTLAAKIEELELKSDGNNNLIKTEESRAKNAESSLHSSVVSTNNALNTERSERTAAEAQLRAELNAKQLEIGAVELDAVPTKDSTNMVNSGAVYTALQDMTYDVSVKHPASGVDSGNTYTLSGALSVIPTANRKVGMSIKFIDSEKNEYVQYRFLGATTDGFTTVANWAIADEGIYVENPEFVYIKTDREGKILWAIKIDGGIYYGAGCPQQVKDYIEEKISSLPLDEYEDMVAFLSDYLEGDATLKSIIDNLANTKVDKVVGKSLIDVEFAEGVSQIENPEFAEVHTYADDKILYGVKQDGDFYFGAGVPSQIQEELDDLAENKVDKEEGKSLIDAEHASTKSTIDNPEFLEVTTDSEGKVLEGIQVDGTKVIGGGINVGGNARILGDMEVYGVSYKVIENSEFLAAWVDAEDKVIFGLKSDGKTYVGDADFLNDIENIKVFLANITDKNIDWDALSSVTVDDNSEFIEAKTDAEGKILAGRTPNGVAFENVGFSTPEVSIDGHTIENIEDQEGRTEITTDSEGKIISYRDGDGMKHENVGIETNNANINHLNLTDTGMTEFQQALKDAGFQPSGTGDWSDYLSTEEPLCIAEPRFALVNISGVDNMPTTKGTNAKAWFELWDMQGNYFKKRVILDAQGRTTLNYPKKNFAADFIDYSPIKEEDWSEDDSYYVKDNSDIHGYVKVPKGTPYIDGMCEEIEFNLRIGDWVAQDSFHYKAQYADFFRGISIIAYKIFDQVQNSRSPLYGNPWKKALLSDKTFTSGTYNNDGFDDLSLQVDTGAKCVPDGFPCAVYLNGNFYGIFNWALKKSRDNYHLKKDNPLHVHLDGGRNPQLIPLSWEGTEIRNPKYLVYASPVNGSYEYDADIAQAEIAGLTSVLENYNSSKTYNSGKFVSYSSSVFKSLKDTTGDVPVAGSSTDAWEDITYNPGKVYSKGDIVLLSGRYYMSVSDSNTGHSPSGASYGKKPKNVYDKATEYWIEITYTNTVKQSILIFNYSCNAVNSLSDSFFNEHFDKENLIDYYLCQLILADEDIYANYQWITYDGIKWWISDYDKDRTYGQIYNSIGVRSADNVLVGSMWGCFHGDWSPIKYVIDHYSSEILQRYSDLRKNIFTENHLISMIKDWVDRIGADYMKREFEKWPESPCNRDSKIDREYWVVSKSNYSTSTKSTYDPNTTYAVGDSCSYGLNTFVNFTCIKDIPAGEVHPPIKAFYDENPRDLGYRDSFGRVVTYISERIPIIDDYLGYTAE